MEIYEDFLLVKNKELYSKHLYFFLPYNFKALGSTTQFSLHICNFYYYYGILGQVLHIEELCNHLLKATPWYCNRSVLRYSDRSIRKFEAKIFTQLVYEAAKDVDIAAEHTHRFHETHGYREDRAHDLEDYPDFYIPKTKDHFYKEELIRAYIRDNLPDLLSLRKSMDALDHSLQRPVDLLGPLLTLQPSYLKYYPRYLTKKDLLFLILVLRELKKRNPFYYRLLQRLRRIPQPLPRK